ncbi:MAG TPA: IS110 family transposase [Paludibacteraceae bacterium]|mgnify:FL=1|nr:IS110 family transposase [Paludibacteraceae bacterium]
MKKVFIGIDFSKLKFDAAIYSVDTKAIVSSEVFDNEQSGYVGFFQWVKENTCCQKSEMLFCGEHTGYYSGNLSVFLYESGYDMWLVSGLEMKLTQGIKRNKTDRVDACKIAEHAYRYQDKVVLFQPVSKALDEIRELLSYRERLVETRKVLTTSVNEMKRVKDNTSCDYIYQDSIEYIKKLNASVRDCERRIETLMKQDVALKTNYKLVSSVVGIGLVNAALIMVTTANFTLFDNPRKFGCYCGVVPFEHSSGSSVRGKTRVSKMANRRIKTTLTLAARNSVRFDPELKEYYERKISEGKNSWLVMNNVKNKLIHRIFAVVRDGQMYEKQYIHPLKQAA